MKRVIAAAVAFMLATAVGVGAQEPRASSNMFGKASIEKVIAPDKTMAAGTAIAGVGTPAPKVPRSGKNFFKTPWPYIIGGAIAAGIIIAVNSGNNSSTGGPY
jgi:hypothetical protein